MMFVKQMKTLPRQLLLLAMLILTVLILAVRTPLAAQETISMSFQDTPLPEVMAMLSQQDRVNVLLAEGVDANVSVNLYDVTIDQAIRAVANAAGLAVEYRNGNYYIIPHDEVGKYGLSRITELRTFKVQYSDPSEVETILVKHLSEYGQITNLNDRKMLVIEDTPGVLDEIEKLLGEIDREPKQIFIEARILEVTLQDNEAFGLDWKYLFSEYDGVGTIGTRGLSTPGRQGLFFTFISPDFELALDALKTRGRLRTLSTPKLLALENQPAETQIGQNLGYQVTVTTNDVTTTSIEYLDTGIILRVIPSVDQQGRIMLDVQPEVSTGSVNDDGVPSKNTTQVSTQMLVPDGQTVFIGGLIRNTVDETREGVPVLGDLPGVGALFSNRSKTITNTETVVLITPRIVSTALDDWQQDELSQMQRVDNILEDEIMESQTKLELIFDIE